MMHTQVAVIRSWATKMNSFSVSTFVIRLNQDKVSCICHFCIDKVQFKPDLVAMKVNPFIFIKKNGRDILLTVFTDLKRMN
jgi:hypothetical protein